MANLIGSNFPDLYDPRFDEIFDNEYLKAEDGIEKYYRMRPGKLETERFTQIGGLPEMTDFTGTVPYDTVSQGYDITATQLEFVQGIQVERRLVEFDQHDVIMNKPKALADSLNRLRQIHRVRPFVNAFSVDTKFYNNSEGVALCSNSHTTTSGASTASGFDNLVTTGMSATAVASLRIQMIKHRNDQGQEISIMPSVLYIPPDLYETAYEIVGSSGKPDVATNAANVHYGQYEVWEDLWLSTRGSTTDWFMLDPIMMKKWGLLWLDKQKGEFAMVEDFDTLTGKWRVYCIWTQAELDWRWISGADVA